MNRPNNLLLVFGWVLLTVGSVNAQPGWVTKPPAGNSLYLYGVGIAHATDDRIYDRQRADDVARTDIARQLRVTISSRLVSTKVEDADAGITLDTREVIESSVTLTLDGVTIRERHYDKKHKTYYALARLNRQAAADLVAEKIRSAAERARGYLKQADRFEGEGATYRAFLALLQSADERASVELDESIHRALAANSVDALLAAEGLESSFSPTRNQIESRINALVSSLSFSDDDGSGQSIDGGRIQDPLSTRLSMNRAGQSVAASGFPVLFSTAKGRAKLDMRGTTDKHGIIQSVVHQAGTCVHESCIISATVDTSAIRAQAPGEQVARWIARLGDIQTSFELIPGMMGLEDGIGELACRLIHAPALTETYALPTIAVARFTYENTRISGPFTGPLRRIMQAQLADLDRGRVIERVDLSAGTAEYGDPNATATIAREMQADVVVWGDYWESGDSVVVNARMTGSDGSRFATATVIIPRGAIPYQVRPPALDPDIPEPPRNGLPLKVWTERGDGGLFVEGERLTAYITTESDGYLRLLYRQVDGSVIQIFPNQLSGDERVSAGQVYSIPDVDDGFDYVVQPPFGVEYLIAVAGATPFPRLPGREINGGILLQGSVRDVIQRLTGGRTWYGQALCRLTTVGQ